MTSHLGDPERKPLTVAQFRTLASRVRGSTMPADERDLTGDDLIALGYSKEMAQRIVELLSQQALLDYYLSKGHRSGCAPLTRADEEYPLRVRKCLGEDSPGSLWIKGDLSLLSGPCVSLVGSRELCNANKAFAAAVGRQAALQGYTLVSGNARGADRTAQEACLGAGGKVICVVADSLENQRPRDRVLYLSEDGFNCPFSSQRALSRNRIIHSMGCMTFVAQSSHHTGGTWDGTVKNLSSRWSPVFCYADGTKAVGELEMMGAVLINGEQLADFSKLPKEFADISIELS